jgi:hypothetical protein
MSPESKVRGGGGSGNLSSPLDLEQQHPHQHHASTTSLPENFLSTTSTDISEPTMLIIPEEVMFVDCAGVYTALCQDYSTAASTVIAAKNTNMESADVSAHTYNPHHSIEEDERFSSRNSQVFSSSEFSTSSTSSPPIARDSIPRSLAVALSTLVDAADDAGVEASLNAAFNAQSLPKDFSRLSTSLVFSGLRIRATMQSPIGSSFRAVTPTPSVLQAELLPPNNMDGLFSVLSGGSSSATSNFAVEIGSLQEHMTRMQEIFDMNSSEMEMLCLAPPSVPLKVSTAIKMVMPSLFVRSEEIVQDWTPGTVAMARVNPPIFGFDAAITTSSSSLSTGKEKKQQRRGSNTSVGSDTLGAYQRNSDAQLFEDHHLPVSTLLTNSAARTEALSALNPIMSVLKGVLAGSLKDDSNSKGLRGGGGVVTENKKAPINPSVSTSKTSSSGGKTNASNSVSSSLAGVNGMNKTTYRASGSTSAVGGASMLYKNNNTTSSSSSSSSDRKSIGELRGPSASAVANLTDAVLSEIVDVVGAAESLRRASRALTLSTSSPAFHVTPEALEQITSISAAELSGSAPGLVSINWRPKVATLALRLLISASSKLQDSHKEDSATIEKLLDNIDMLIASLRVQADKNAILSAEVDELKSALRLSTTSTANGVHSFLDDPRMRLTDEAKGGIIKTPVRNIPLGKIELATRSNYINNIILCIVSMCIGAVVAVTIQRYTVE